MGLFDGAYHYTDLVENWDLDLAVIQQVPSSWDSKVPTNMNHRKLCLQDYCMLILIKSDLLQGTPQLSKVPDSLMISLRGKSPISIVAMDDLSNKHLPELLNRLDFDHGVFIVGQLKERSFHHVEDLALKNFSSIKEMRSENSTPTKHIFFNESLFTKNVLCDDEEALVVDFEYINNLESITPQKRPRPDEEDLLPRKFKKNNSGKPIEVVSLDKEGSEVQSSLLQNNNVSRLRSTQSQLEALNESIPLKPDQVIRVISWKYDSLLYGEGFKLEPTDRDKAEEFFRTLDADILILSDPPAPVLTPFERTIYGKASSSKEKTFMDGSESKIPNIKFAGLMPLNDHVPGPRIFVREGSLISLISAQPLRDGYQFKLKVPGIDKALTIFSFMLLTNDQESYLNLLSNVQGETNRGILISRLLANGTVNSGFLDWRNIFKENPPKYTTTSYAYRNEIFIKDLPVLGYYLGYVPTFESLPIVFDLEKDVYDE